MTLARALLVVLLMAAGGCPDRTPMGDGDGGAVDGGLPDARPAPDARREPACGDELDNDNDGVIDFPWEPGCESHDDDDETDPAVPPACSNGIDDDFDGWIDLVDPGCSFAADPDEFHGFYLCYVNHPVIDITGSGMASGTFTGVASETESPNCGGGGEEWTFMYNVLLGPVTLVVSTDYPDTTADTIIHVRTECRRPEFEIGCDDDGAGTTGGPSVLTLDGMETGTYYIFVDAYSPASLGDFVLTVTEGP